MLHLLCYCCYLFILFVKWILKDFYEFQRRETLATNRIVENNKKKHPHSQDIRAKRWGTDEQTLKIIREELGEIVEKSDLDWTYRIGTFKEDKNKCRPITVKFSRYNVCVTKSSWIRKKNKGKGYSITETLTALRMKKFTEAHNSFGFTNVWTQDGKILCKKDNRINVFF